MPARSTSTSTSSAIRAARRSRAQHHRDRRPGPQHHDRGQDQSRDVTSRSRTSSSRSRSHNGSADFLEKRSGRRAQGSERRAVHGRFPGCRIAKPPPRCAITRLAGDGKNCRKRRPISRSAQEKYQRMLAETELVDLAPERLLEIGLQRFKEEQEIFAEAAKTIDPNKPADRSFQANPERTSHAGESDSRGGKESGADPAIRGRPSQLVAIPSDVRAQVTETPQYRRATTFRLDGHPGPFEKKATEAYYYVTPVEAEWTDKQKEEWLTSFNYYTTDIVSIQRPIPAITCSSCISMLRPRPRWKKFSAATPSSKAGRITREKMMLDEGFGSVPKPTPDDEKSAPQNIAWPRPTKPSAPLPALRLDQDAHPENVGR